MRKLSQDIGALGLTYSYGEAAVPCRPQADYTTDVDHEVVREVEKRAADEIGDLANWDVVSGYVGTL